MISFCLQAVTQTSGNWNLVLLLGIIVFLGTFGSRFAQRIRIPQVVGCVIIGVILGPHVFPHFFPKVFTVITRDTIEDIEPLTMFALGFIGFMIGGELRTDVFKKYGKQFFVILLSQGVGAFLLVALTTSITAWFILPNIMEGIELANRLHLSVAMGLVLGAIASATAPAATTNVLWEYKTRGPLTAAILAIVALDDALALLLYRGAATGAQAIMGTSSSSFAGTAMILFLELVGVALLGFAAGLVLYFLLKFIRSDEKILGFTIALLALVVGITIYLGIEPILPSMIFGITIANLAKRRSKSIFGLVKKFSPPVYTAFFVLAGAHIEFGSMSLYIAILTAVYIFFRVLGKIIGSGVGAKYSKAPKVVQKYLGICLLPQAGVAIGLAIVSGQLFSSELAKVIIIVVMTGTFIIEILGPILVKIGIKKAGEVGLNVTEEDLIKIYTVKDVMDAEPTAIDQGLLLQEILDKFSTSESIYYPVINEKSQIKGIITIAGIKEMFANQDVAGWLLACDVAEPVLDKTTVDTPLEEAIEHMQRYDLENIPVVNGEDNEQLAGVLDYRRAMHKISAEVLRRRREAEGSGKSV
ncbi:MAG: cation:proton antiporter domain-containing protein [Planctomycetota bacterium]|jgi:Kef-type K+ transport system membrane component KefB